MVFSVLVTWSCRWITEMKVFLIVILVTTTLVLRTIIGAPVTDVRFFVTGTSIRSRTVRRDLSTAIAIVVVAMTLVGRGLLVLLLLGGSTLTIVVPIQGGARPRSVWHWDNVRTVARFTVRGSELVLNVDGPSELILFALELGGEIVSPRLSVHIIGTLAVFLHHSIVIVVEHVTHQSRVPVPVVSIFVPEVDV